MKRDWSNPEWRKAMRDYIRMRSQETDWRPPSNSPRQDPYKGRKWVQTIEAALIGFVLLAFLWGFLEGKIWYL